MRVKVQKITLPTHVRRWARNKKTVHFTMTAEVDRDKSIARLQRQLAMTTGAFINSTIKESRAIGDKAEKANAYIREHALSVSKGTCTVDSINLLYSWLGHVLIIMLSRYKQNKTLRIGIQCIAAGRRAILQAWLLQKNEGRIAPLSKDSDTDLQYALNLGTEFLKATSPSEVRKAFAQSDKREARFAALAQAKTLV